MHIDLHLSMLETCWHVGVWYLHITLTRSQRKFSASNIWDSAIKRQTRLFFVKRQLGVSLSLLGKEAQYLSKQPDCYARPLKSQLGVSLGMLGKEAQYLSKQPDWRSWPKYCKLKIARKRREKCVGGGGSSDSCKCFDLNLPTCVGTFWNGLVWRPSPTKGVYNTLRECSGYTQLRLFGVCWRPHACIHCLG